MPEECLRLCNMKAKLSKLLRKYNLLFIADKFRFWINANKNRQKNQEFSRKHPDFIFPPDYLMYESFQINYESYYNSGKSAAEWLVNTAGRYTDFNNVKILDWGCGPARIIRHFPSIVPKNCELYATDYNKNSIEWNIKNIKGVEFNLNGLKAELPYQDDFFDFIYGISIFTHLSEQLHYDWKNELSRVLKKDGILLLSLQGNFFKTILTPQEIEDFDKGKLVVRGKVKEGHRTYSAFHPDEFVKKLFADFEVLEHIDSYNNNGRPEQDIWVLRKK